MQNVTSNDNIRVRAIEQKDDRTLSIQWTDDSVQLFDVVDLRRSCPCASCIDEWTHERVLKPESVADSVRPIRIDSVGHYAMTIAFNDQHRTGIYTFKLLRSLSKPLH